MQRVINVTVFSGTALLQYNSESDVSDNDASDMDSIMHASEEETVIFSDNEYQRLADEECTEYDTDNIPTYLYTDIDTDCEAS